jgi:hypothetical protein
MKTKTLIAVLLVAIVLVSCAPAVTDITTETAIPTAAATITPTSIPTLQDAAYYVAPSGNDSNPGTMDRPWQTIQKAADTLIAGDTVYIRDYIKETQADL